MRIQVYGLYPIPLEDVTVTLPVQNFLAICNTVPFDLSGKGIITYGVSKDILDLVNWKEIQVRELKTLDIVEGYEQETEPKYFKSVNRSGDFSSIISPYYVDAEYKSTYHSPYYLNMMNNFFGLFMVKEKRLKYPRHVKMRWDDPYLKAFLEYNKVNVHEFTDDVIEKYKNPKVNMGTEDMIDDVRQALKEQGITGRDINTEEMKSQLDELLNKKLEDRK